jgi:hypothetical protein
MTSIDDQFRACPGRESRPAVREDQEVYFDLTEVVFLARKVA